MIMRLATVEKEQRHESILLSLKKLGYLNRTQIQRLHRLGSTRNANRILNDLRPYLNIIKRGEYVYTLNAEGRRRIGDKPTQMRASQIDHHLLRNQLYITIGCPADWRVEVRLKVADKINVIADALFTKSGRYFIAEIDNMQKMAANREKITKYRELSNMGVFKKEPQFIWLTTTEYRRRELARYSEGLNTHIYTLGELN